MNDISTHIVMAAEVFPVSTIEVLFSYSHRDRELVEKIMMALEPLRRQGVAFTSIDSSFLSGSDWTSQINGYINRANIILLFISPNFLGPFRYSQEIRQAPEMDKLEKTRVIPVILRPVSWRGIELNKLKVVLPTGGKPLSTWSDLEIACFDVAQGVQRVVGELAKDIPSPSSPTLEIADITQKKIRLAQLEDELRLSYSFMKEYENKFRLSYEPPKKLEVQKSFHNRLERTGGILSEYMRLANEIGYNVPTEIIQAIARSEDISNQEM